MEKTNCRMLHVRLDVFCVFYISTLLALMLSGQGHSAVIGPIQPIVATVGDDIILPCYLYPTMDASDMTVEWTRPDLESRLVHVQPERAELQNPSYKGRTSLFTDELKHGEISLKISKVKLSDEGTYKCFVPDLRRDSAVRLVVGAASSPVAQINRTIGGVVLQCESAGWHPEPELLWLDGEGNLLSAGPSETLRGPDDLYTVSSRVTVEKRHSNNITCRVQQKNISQSRETHIHVPDDFFMVISPSSPPNDPTIVPNTITGLVIGAAVVLALVLAVFCFVWKRRRLKCRNKKKNEEDGPEQTRKEKTIDSKNDNCEFHVVMEEGESEPLMAGREGEDDVESRGEKNSKEERETRQDETETEQRRDADGPATNTSTMTETESQIKMKQETCEEQEVTGRQERNDVDSRGEQSNKDERETQDHQEELKDGFRRSEEERMNPFILTERVSQSAAGQENGEKLEMRGRGMKAEGGEGEREKNMEGGKNYSGLQFFPLTEEHKEQPVLVKEAKSFNLTSHLNSDQKPRREKETEKEQLVAVRQRESDVSRKQSDSEKKRSEENRSEEFKAQKKKREHQREKMLTERREKNQRKQSESRMEREKDETEVKIRKSKNQHHKEEKREERREEEPENEKHGEGNQRDRTGMTERKTEEQRGQEESRNSSVSSKITLNTDLTTQEKRRGQNQETQAEEKSEIREQPEKQRRAQSEGGGQREMMEVNEGVTADGTNRKEREKLQLTHEGALQAEQQENVNQKEEPEEPVSVTERGVDCLEEPQKQELMEVDEAPDVDQNNIQRGKHMQEIKLHEVCEQSVKKEKIQEGGGARKHQNVRKVKKFVKKQNDDHVEVDDAAHSQSAAITQQHETIQWTKEQPMLSEQNETQEYLTEHEEEPMEVEERSGLQFPPFTEEHKEQPVLLAGAEPFSFTFHLISDQKPWREKEKQKDQLVSKRQRNSDMDMKNSDIRKKRSEENRSVVNKLYSMFKAPKKTGEYQREKLLTEQLREKKQRTKQSESRMEREKDETEVKIRKSKNQHHKEEKTQEKRRRQSQETQAEEKSEQSREEIREQPEKQRRAQSEGGGQREMMEVNEGVTADGTNRKEREKLQLTHEGALQAEQQENVNQKEEPEEPVSVTERGVDCLEEPQKQELMDETPDVDLHKEQEMTGSRMKAEEGEGEREKKMDAGKESEENQRKIHSETRMEKEKDESELKIQKENENQLHKEQENVNPKEEPEEPVSVTERRVDCLEEPQKKELMEVDEAPDVDQNNIQSRKHTQEIKMHEVCNLPAKKQKIQEEGGARKHQNVRKVKKHVKKQNDDHVEVGDAAHSQSAAITQQHETMKWTKEQQMLSEQKDTQEYLREHEEEQMEVEEHSGLQFPPFTQEPKEQPVLLAGAENFNLINNEDAMEVEEHSDSMSSQCS